MRLCLLGLVNSLCVAVNGVFKGRCLAGGGSWGRRLGTRLPAASETSRGTRGTWAATCSFPQGRVHLLRAGDQGDLTGDPDTQSRRLRHSACPHGQLARWLGGPFLTTPVAPLEVTLSVSEDRRLEVGGGDGAQSGRVSPESTQQGRKEWPRVPPCVPISPVCVGLQAVLRSGGKEKGWWERGKRKAGRPVTRVL